MKIISWNVNGIRAIYKKGAFEEVFTKLKPDILCLQETKAEATQLGPDILEHRGYFSYFSHSLMRKGYSGVAIFSKTKPKKVETGIGVPEMDQEGRTLIAYFDDFVLINCYFPNGGQGPHRLEYKLKFYDEFLKKINKLKKSGKKIIFCGDINTAHTAIDLARPKENEKNTGFLPIERAWLDEVVANGYVDVFRNFYPNKLDVYTYWDQKTRARDRNVGWRIDYFFASQNIIKNIKSFKTHTDFLGSDHCPIEINLEF